MYGSKRGAALADGTPITGTGPSGPAIVSWLTIWVCPCRIKVCTLLLDHGTKPVAPINRLWLAVALGNGRVVDHHDAEQVVATGLSQQFSRIARVLLSKTAGRVERHGRPA